MARVCRRFLEDEGIDTIDWPARSPDLNLIEHVWDTMDQRIRRLPNLSRTVQELTNSLVEVWQNIDLGTIRRLIRRSIPRRCGACIQARGIIPAINVSFQYDWMNGRNFRTNSYLDYHFVFRHDFVNLSSSGNSPFALANFAQFCSG